MHWIETRTAAEAKKRREAMWGVVMHEDVDGELTSSVSGDGLSEGGVFWADAIKEMRDDPERRLAFAKRHLPLPAAFREAAVALRAIIRASRKSGAAIEQPLQELHHLAAIWSLGAYDDLDSTPYSQVAALNLSPSALGWDELPLLTQSDRKLMDKTWATPERHTTARAFYPDVFGAGSRTEAAERQFASVMPRAEDAQPVTRAGSTYTLGLAGESFGDRQAEIARCRVGKAVRLVREPDNAHDPNAIRCETARGASIGMISRDNASWLAGRIDRGDDVQAVIREVPVQPGKAHKGVVIDCHLNGGDGRTPEPVPQKKKGFFARLFG